VKSGRSFEQQRYRASGLNLVTAAIVLWNTVYLERATNVLRGQVRPWMMRYCSTCRRWVGVHQLDRRLLWRSSTKIGVGKFRPLGHCQVLAYDFFRFLRRPLNKKERIYDSSNKPLTNDPVQNQSPAYVLQKGCVISKTQKIAVGCFALATF